MIACARCGRPMPDVREDELRGDVGGDPSLLPVVIPADGWIAVPDGDGVICGECSMAEEITAWLID
jgi:hypothetical protein